VVAAWRTLFMKLDFFLNRFGVSCKFDFGGNIKQFAQIMLLQLIKYKK